MKRTLGERRCLIQLHRSVTDTHETKYGTHTSTRAVPNGTRAGTVVLRVDVDALLAELGPRALRSKRGVTRLARGMIEVVALRETVHDSPENGI